MSDITFSKEFSEFNAIKVDVKPTSDAGAEFFEKHFGRGACGATLYKNGAYDFAGACSLAGLKTTVEWKGA